MAVCTGSFPSRSWVVFWSSSECAGLWRRTFVKEIDKKFEITFEGTGYLLFFLMWGVLVLYFCCNKLPRIWWLTTPQQHLALAGWLVCLGCCLVQQKVAGSIPGQDTCGRQLVNVLLSHQHLSLCLSLWIQYTIPWVRIIKAPHICSHPLTVLGVRSLKSVSRGSNQRVGRVLTLLEALGKNPFLAFSSF